MTTKIFMVWSKTDQFWYQYDSIEYAAEENPGEPVFEAVPKMLGIPEITTTFKFRKPTKKKAKKK